MTRFILYPMVGLVLLSCANPAVFPVPTIVPLPDGWNSYSHVMSGDSECPTVAGSYAEPPDRYSTSGSQFALIEYPRLGYIAVMPLYLADKQKVSQAASGLKTGEFELLQLDGSRFSLRDVDFNGMLREHTFERSEGDFVCKDGLMYFPLVIRYGADQQGSFNFQLQPILTTDTKGNLVLIRISGPYKKTLFHSTPAFEYDFMRYSKTN